MLDPLDDGAGGRLSAGTHRDQRRALIGAPRSRSAMVITRLPALPTRQPSTIVPRFQGAAAAGSDAEPRQHHPRLSFLPLKWAGLLDSISLAARWQILVSSIR